MPKVSVLIPTYNCAKYIGKAIQSALEQTFEDFEITVSDNASTDNTEEIVKRFKDSRIRYYKNRENIGYTRNVRKLIYELARGEHFIILCADDYWIGDILKIGENILDKKKKITFVHTAFIVMNIIDHVNYEVIFKEMKEITPGDQMFRLLSTDRKFWIALPSCIFRRKEVMEVRGFMDDKIICASDWELYLKLSLRGDVGYIKEPVVAYRWHPDNLSNLVNIKDRFYERLYIVDKIFEESGSKRLLTEWRNCAIESQWKNFVKSFPSLKASFGRSLEVLNCIREVYSGRKIILLDIRLFPYLASALFFPSAFLRLLRRLHKISGKKDIRGSVYG